MNVIRALVCLCAALAAAGPASAQQLTGTLGSPSATTTIDGRQLPPPEFGGVIEDGALQSTPWWTPRIVPPEGAPNGASLAHKRPGFPPAFRITAGVQLNPAWTFAPLTT
jgi:arylsulfatase